MGTQRTVENREYSVVHGVQIVQEHWGDTEDGREQRVQCSTWSTESTGTLGEHRGQWRTVENREYSVVRGVQRVQEH